MPFTQRGALSAVAAFLAALTALEAAVDTAALAAPAPPAPSAAAVDADAARTIGLLPASAPVRKVYDNARAFDQTYREESGPAKVRVLTRVKNSIDHGDTVVHLPSGARLAANEAVVYSGPAATSVAVIPIVGVDLVAPSALIVQFGAKSKMTTIERQFRPLGSESGRDPAGADPIVVLEQVRCLPQQRGRAVMADHRDLHRLRGNLPRHGRDGMPGVHPGHGGRLRSHHQRMHRAGKSGLVPPHRRGASSGSRHRA